MRRRSRGDRAPLNAEINVVSLIDVMMLLMVIFMITAPIMQGGVDVKLPKAEAMPLESKSGLVISITRDGSIFAGDQKMTLRTFRSVFKAMAGKQGKDGVYLRADQNVSYGIVAQVLSIIQGAGVTNLGFVTEPEEVVK
ncbi:MAG TPA: biopolymer transporter ExbD [Gemmatimonadaceae bacterium]|jgi:biopolymer transport protein ExbD/biopolymer transport protein TolR|nr:biopolymer transporter ExbD [Gemmatimonadaceae bacterium]